MKKFSKLSLIIILLVIITIAFNIYIDKINKQNSSNIITGKGNQANNENFNILKLRESVNDDIWYLGKYSMFYAFQSKKLKYKIYRNNFKTVDYFIFDQGVNNLSDSFYGMGIKYYMIGLVKNGQSYSYEISTSAIYDSKKELEADLKAGEYVDTNKSGEITFKTATKPIFPLLDDNKKIIINKIERKLKTDLSDNPYFTKGRYKIFIRDFKADEYATYVCVEGNGKKAIIPYGIDEKGDLVEVDKIIKINTDNLEYLYNQYKRVVILIKDIELGK